MAVSIRFAVGATGRHSTHQDDSTAKPRRKLTGSSTKRTAASAATQRPSHTNTRSANTTPPPLFQRVAARLAKRPVASALTPSAAERRRLQEDRADVASPASRESRIRHAPDVYSPELQRRSKRQRTSHTTQPLTPLQPCTPASDTAPTSPPTSAHIAHSVIASVLCDSPPPTRPHRPATHIA